MRRMTQRLKRAASLILLAGVLLAVTAGCKGKGGSSGNSLTSPSSTTLSGTWTGTLSRPSGFAPITVQWVATHSGENLTGPVTLTSGNTSVTYPLNANVRGGGEQGYNIFWDFRLQPGGAVNLPNCSINSSGAGVTGLREPVTTMTSSTFRMEYFSCQGFVEPDPPSNSRSEETRLTLTKQ